ncbi:hypothetical protein JW805_15590 [Roseomonas aeriglobus]|nr:hypothetical protein [Roseomonas aeriglobus]
MTKKIDEKQRKNKGKNKLRPSQSAGAVLAPSGIRVNPLDTFMKHVEAAIDEHNGPNICWYWLETLARDFDTIIHDVGDGQLRFDGILRDTAHTDWSEDGLARLCDMVAIPAIGLDASAAHGPDANEMAASWAIIRKEHPRAAEALMSGRLGTGIRMVLAEDSQATADLANVVAFHALDSAHLAALDARDRLRDPLQLEVGDLSSNKVPRNGALAKQLEQAWDDATYARRIFQLSGKRADATDTAWVEALGLHGRAFELRLGLDASDEDLLGLLAILLEEGEAATAHLPQLLERHRTKQWSLQEVHRWLKTPAIPLLWNSVVRAAHVHSAVRHQDIGDSTSGGSKRDDVVSYFSWAEQIVVDTNRGFPPADLLPRSFTLPAELPRLLCHRLRIDVVQDEDAIPRKYVAAAARERARGNTDPCWQEPYTFGKVIEGLVHEDKNHGSRFLVEASKEGNAIFEKAAKNASCQKNRRILIEAQGRLWFRLRL